MPLLSDPGADSSNSNTGEIPHYHVQPPHSPDPIPVSPPSAEHQLIDANFPIQGDTSFDLNDVPRASYFSGADDFKTNANQFNAFVGSVLVNNYSGDQIIRNGVSKLGSRSNLSFSLGHDL